MKISGELLQMIFKTKNAVISHEIHCVFLSKVDEKSEFACFRFTFI